MCSLSDSRLENCLRVHLLSCLSLLDEASNRATTINVSLSFPIKRTPRSVHLCSFSVSALFSQVPSRLWKMAAHTEPGSAGGFFLLKGSFPLHCRFMHAHYEGLLQSQCKRLSTVSTCSSRRTECCKSLT
ncbi:hypothetical protein ATANTOWER_024050 [Ataeniobius toweri]|uniref:Uncharacterized protein n=1 Tax=Ataeniobius toweri TaxID=208326 RepID=A0ABU7ARQ1_9TELE|nr:hypothetical protein [Ataeniobius toweri]